MHWAFMRALVQSATLVAAAVPCFASDVEAELTQLEAVRRQAIKDGDFATLEQIYAPNFIAITGNGQIVDRARLFALFKQTDPSLVFATDEVRVQVGGGAAVFMGRLVASRSTEGVVSRSRFSHVFVREGDRWVCIAGQSTPIAVQPGG